MSYYTQPHDKSIYGGGGSHGSNYYDPSIDFTQAVSQAKYHRTGKQPATDDADDDDDDDDEETSFFSKAIGFISEHKDKLGKEDIDEDHAVSAHQELYSESGSSKTHDADSLGSGAAMQALKMFLSSDDDDDEKQQQQQQQEKSGGGGKNDQNKFIGIAMAQAGKLWDQKNKEGKAATDKQSAVNSAAKYALQMYLKGNQGGSGTGGLGGLAGKLAGGSSSGSGGSGLLSMAKKFL